MFDDFVEELDLIGCPGFASEKAGQGLLGCVSFQADERAHEEAEALLSGGGLDLLGGSDFRQDAF